MKSKIIIFSALCFLIFSMLVMLGGISQAQRGAEPPLEGIPHSINFQGILRDSSGAPVSDQTVTVILLDKNKTPILGTSASDTTAANGFLNVVIDLPDTFNYDLLNGPVYARVSTVDGKGNTVTLTPDQPFFSVPYALNAERLGGLKLEEIQAGTGGVAPPPEGEDFLDTSAVAQLKKGTLWLGPSTPPEDRPDLGLNVLAKDKGINSYGQNVGIKATGGTGIGVQGVGHVAGVSAESISGYSGYFTGGKGVKIIGPLEVTANKTIIRKEDFADLYDREYGLIASGHVNTAGNVGVVGLVTATAPVLPSNGAVGVAGLTDYGIGVYGKGTDLVVNGAAQGGVVGTTVDNPELPLYGFGVFGQCDSGYGGYFKGPQGVYIDGPLNVTGDITAPNLGGEEGVPDPIVPADGKQNIDGKLQAKTVIGLSSDLNNPALSLDVGIYGESGSAGRSGVYGKGPNSDRKPGVIGIAGVVEPVFNYDSGEITDERIGVYGESFDIGVVGYGPVYGVYGKGGPPSPQPGHISYGVFGESKSGYGVVGRSSSGKMGVVGLTYDKSAPTVNLEAGVYGETGVTASGVFGYHTADEVITPWFLAPIGAVAGAGNGAAGVSGFSIKNVGVHGFSQNNAGVYARGEPDIELHNGTMKMPVGEGSISSAGDLGDTNDTNQEIIGEVTINNAMGVVTNYAGKGGWIRVNNNKVAANSIVFMCPQNWGFVLGMGVCDIQDNSFCIYNMGNGARMAFWVINPK